MTFHFATTIPSSFTTTNTVSKFNPLATSPSQWIAQNFSVLASILSPTFGNISSSLKRQPFCPTIEFLAGFLVSPKYDFSKFYKNQLIINSCSFIAWLFEVAAMKRRISMSNATYRSRELRKRRELEIWTGQLSKRTIKICLVRSVRLRETEYGLKLD